MSASIAAGADRAFLLPAFNTDPLCDLQPMGSSDSGPFFAEVSAGSPKRNMRANCESGGIPTQATPPLRNIFSTLNEKNPEMKNHFNLEIERNFFGDNEIESRISAKQTRKRPRAPVDRLLRAAYGPRRLTRGDVKRTGR